MTERMCSPERVQPADKVEASPTGPGPAAIRVGDAVSALHKTAGDLGTEQE